MIASATTARAASRSLAPRSAQPARPGFAQTLRAEWIKFWTVRSTLWSTVALFGLGAGLTVLVCATSADWLASSEADESPASFVTWGMMFAQITAVVLGAMAVTSEYGTGMIRATLAATPQRVTVLAAKAATFTGVILTTGTVASFSAFWTGQAIFASKGLDVSISEPGVLRAVFGGALYLAAVGLLGIGLGVILRRTAGAVAALVGLLVLAPLVGGFLPASFQESAGKYFPAQAGMAVFGVVPDPTALAPWTGYGVLLAYVVGTLVVGGLLLARRDA